MTSWLQNVTSWTVGLLLQGQVDHKTISSLWSSSLIGEAEFTDYIRAPKKCFKCLFITTSIEGDIAYVLINRYILQFQRGAVGGDDTQSLLTTLCCCTG